jgi:hypothetical protein
MTMSLHPHERLLTELVEELATAAAVAAHALTAGVDSSALGPATCREMIESSLGRILAQLDGLVAAGVLRRHRLEWARSGRGKKKGRPEAPLRGAEKA